MARHLVSSSQGAHARADMHGDPADVIAAHLTLAGVQPGPHLDAERLHCVTNCHGAANRSLLVSSTVRDLVIGSGIEFDDRGTHQLKGVPGEWRLFAVAS